MQDNERIRSNVFLLGKRDIDLDFPQLVNSGLKKFEELKKSELFVPKFNSISLRTVKKFIITCPESIDAELTPDDFIEIVDYDPVRDSALALGAKQPPRDILLHWLIYRAVNNINVIVNVDIDLSPEFLEKFKIRTLEKEMKVITPEAAMGILPVLIDTNLIYLEDHGLLVYGESLMPIIDDIITLIKELGEHKKK